MLDVSFNELGAMDGAWKALAAIPKPLSNQVTSPRAFADCFEQSSRGTRWTRMLGLQSRVDERCGVESSGLPEISGSGPGHHQAYCNSTKGEEGWNSTPLGGHQPTKLEQLKS